MLETSKDKIKQKWLSFGSFVAVLSIFWAGITNYILLTSWTIVKYKWSEGSFVLGIVFVFQGYFF